MKKLIFNTSNSYAPLPVRALLAQVLFLHGAQKLLGWFDGFGFTGTMNFFTEMAGLPWIVGFLVILIEFLGPLALLLGWAIRLWAISLVGVFTGIIIYFHHNYFFMNWFGLQKGEGAEFFLLAIGISISLLISGAGKISLDAWLQKKASATNNLQKKPRNTVLQPSAA